MYQLIVYHYSALKFEQNILGRISWHTAWHMKFRMSKIHKYKISYAQVPSGSNIFPTENLIQIRIVTKLFFGMRI